MKNKKGMSLIVLVITILVMIILAGVVIVSLSDNNPIKKASEAAEKANYAEYAGELELYHVNNTALSPGYSKNELNVTDSKEMKEYIKSMTKKDTEKYEIIGGILLKKGILTAGEPKLVAGMTPIKWVNNVEQETIPSDPEWYKYVEGTDAIDHKSTKLANAKTADGSYFVWIPRFEYKIKYKDKADKSQGGEIFIKMIPADKKNPSLGYEIHPAFTNGTSNKFANGECDTELPGIWVAKYEMSEKDSKPASLPHVASWRGIKIGDIYTKCFDYDRAKESHMIKNSEWGAVAYFTHSKYGRNQNEVEINENLGFITGNGEIATHVLESNTGNITGIYDLSGCAWEYVAGYINNGDTKLTTYGGSFATSKESTKYATVYSFGKTDTAKDNYKTLADALSSRYGDALVEISDSGEGSTSFFGNHSNFPYMSSSFFARGGDRKDGGAAGTFAFDENDGDGYSDFTSRLVLHGV